MSSLSSLFRAGENNPPLVVAEIGLNHNGDIVLAKEMISAAAECGADIVKFQSYRTEDFLTNGDLRIQYESRGRKVEESQLSLFKRCELKLQDWFDLMDFCTDRGVEFQCTPTSVSGVQDLVDLGVESFKNGSDFLGNLELIRAMGETSLPTIISTGMSTLKEIEQAVTVFRETDNHQLVLLHCVSLYPTPKHLANLCRIQALHEYFGCPVGLSDHSEDNEIATYATVLGAKVIEKHFTLDRGLEGPDHAFSTTPRELRDLVIATRSAFQILGSGTIDSSCAEDDARREYKLSCVARVNIDLGEVLDETKVRYGRPGSGIPPAEIHSIIGRTLNKSVAQGHIFSYEDFKE